MRRRRATRCLLRAEVAIEAGFADDACAALDEARLLNAPDEEIARVEALIAAAGARALEQQHRKQLSWRYVAAAIAFIMAATAFASHTILRNTPASSRPATAPSAAAPAAAAPAAAAPVVAEPPPERPSVSVQTVQNVPIVSTVAFAPLDADATPAPPTTRTQTERAAPPAHGANALVTDRSSTDNTRTRVEPAPPTIADARPPAPPASTPLASTPLASTPLASTRLPNITPLPPPAAPPARETVASTETAAPVLPPSVDTVPSPSAPVRDEAADVRAVLAHYENAYTQLNPALARTVWPGVDERALARAFGSLASQRVSLGRCDVSLSAGTARATCAGSATWTPKVGGGGARTEARRWTFDLRKSGDAWRIERALAR